MGGRGSLAGLMPYGDANEIVVDMAREVLPVVKETPVLAGVCGTDPFRLMPVFIAELKRIGFSGVQNFPTVGLIDGTFRVNLEETGMGYGLEVDVIRIAHELDLLTAPYVFNDDEATAMAEAGADVLVPHMGLTTGGSIGADTAKTLDDCVPLIQGMHDAAKRVNPDDHRALPRRPDRRAGRRGLHPRAHRGRRRLLRRLVDGAAADRGRDDREHAAVQVDTRMKEQGGKMSRFVMKPDVDGDQYDWGGVGSRSTTEHGLAGRSSSMEVTLLPGKCHDFHRHPGQDEVIYVKSRARSSSGSSRRSGALTRRLGRHHRDVVHATFNDGGEAAKILVILAPAVGDDGYELVDVAGDEPWASLR